MEIGDKILCKKKFIYIVNIFNFGWLEKLLLGKTLFKKGRYYEIKDISPPYRHTGPMCTYCHISTEFGKEFSFPEEFIDEHFHTPREVRKLKLKKIKKSR